MTDHGNIWQLLLMAIWSLWRRWKWPIVAFLCIAFFSVFHLAFAAQGDPLVEVEKGGSIPPWAFFIIILFGWIAGALLTIIAGTMRKVINRDDGEQPIKKGKMIKHVLADGFFLGLVCQFTFQGVISYVTGVPVFWEMLAGIPFLTGLLSFAIYEFLLHRWKTKRPRMYARLKVIHVPGVHTTGEVTADDAEDIAIAMEHDDTVMEYKRENGLEVYGSSEAKPGE